MRRVAALEDKQAEMEEDFGAKPGFVFHVLKRRRLARQGMGVLETWALFPAFSLVRFPCPHGWRSP